MNAFMYVSMSVSLRAYKHINVCTTECIYACMYKYMYVSMYEGMDVCLFV